jgi:mono/diheme cytochrome c family protein
MFVILLTACAGTSPTEVATPEPATETPTEDPWPREYNVPAEDAAFVNPIKADAASLQRGREIYESSCLKCHGEEGRGDGPSVTNPIDFREEFVVELSDGEIFYLITNGVEGSEMWAFNFLDDDQRWHLVNYIRTLQE